MARLLHHRDREEDEWNREACDCSRGEWDDEDCDCHHHHHPCDDEADFCICWRCRRRRKRRDLIPAGRVTVDCTPVSFETPGQARTVLNCPGQQVIFKPVVRTIPVPVLGLFKLPVTQVSKVPVVGRAPFRPPFAKPGCPTCGKTCL